MIAILTTTMVKALVPKRKEPYSTFENKAAEPGISSSCPHQMIHW